MNSPTISDPQVFENCMLKSDINVLYLFFMIEAVLSWKEDNKAMILGESMMKRRDFLAYSGSAILGGLALGNSAFAALDSSGKKRVVLVGTGSRGSGFWGEDLLKNFSDKLEFVGLCDSNPGRLAFAKEKLGVTCPISTNFDKLLAEVKPDTIIVTTPDALHHEYIIKGLNFGANVITEKPMTTDENKCRAILNAEKKAKGKLIVGFNYRYIGTFTKLKEMLKEEQVGKITSVDFHWYLNTSHGADYFRRWHAFRKFSGTLLVHKATHHFDLLNWLIDSDPVEVCAYGDLEHYGKNNAFRHTHCRNCPHAECRFRWDITKDEHYMKLYVANEQYDGYFRDACVWRNEIDIYDKMGVIIKYANNVQVTYSLTTYSPFEGWHIAFNGMNGRLETWEDLPWMDKIEVSQDQLHALQMSQEQEKDVSKYNRIIRMLNFKSHEEILVPRFRSGHGGGDIKLQTRIFGDTTAPDPLDHAAGSRDGAMSILIGIAARESIEKKRPIKIADLVDIKPQAVRLKKA